MREWIKVASSLEKTARDSNLFAKKVAAKEIFGSNLILANREARLAAPSGSESKPKKQRAALRAAHQNGRRICEKSNSGAGDGIRTRDILFGREAFYH